MDSMDEFLNVFNGLCELLDDFNLSEALEDALWVELRSLVVKHYPLLEEHLPQFEQRLKDESEIASIGIFFKMQQYFAEDAQSEEGYVAIDHTARESILEKMRKDHAELILQAEPEEYDEVCQECAIEYADRVQYEGFKAECLDVTKALCFHFFPGIIELTGNSIRKIDNMIHLYVSMWGIEFQDTLYCHFDTDMPR